MAKFTWQDGTLVSKAKVEVGGTIYEVDPEEYSGATPLSASNLNAMQDGIYDDIGNIPSLETSNTNLVGAVNEANKRNILSSSEQVVGKWVNGKTLYRRTFTRTGAGNIDISSLGIDLAFFDFTHSIAQLPNIFRWIPIVETSNQNVNSQIGAYFNDDFTQMTIETGGATGLDLGNVIITIEYTKA